MSKCLRYSGEQNKILAITGRFLISVNPHYFAKAFHISFDLQKNLGIIKLIRKPI